MIRVGRCTYSGPTRTDPTFEGFTPILVLTKSSAYGQIGPYCLKDEKGRIMENFFQFSKCYETIPSSDQKYSRWDQRTIWKWPSERHAIKLEDGSWDITEKYFVWRQAGMHAAEAIRYPVGFNHRHNVLFSLKEDENGVIDPRPLSYIESRKEIYVPTYCRLVKKEKQFKELEDRVRAGENLLIIEVDGPHSESLPYYQEKYGVDDDFIIDNTMLINPRNLDIMLNDPKHPFGHGYCLAGALLNIY